MKIFKSGNKKGIALVYIAILIVMLIGFLGLAIDIGYMYSVKGQLQNAADAAALAGAAKINPADLTFNQYSARSAAVSFAAKNTAARESVAVASTPPTNTLSDAFVSGGNDITFGNWNFKNYSAGRTPINAIQVRTRRSVPGADAANQGQVATFLGRIFALLGVGPGVPFMSPGAEAVAFRKPLGLPGITICIDTCALSNTNLYFQDPPGIPDVQKVAWTSFRCEQAPNIGKNGDVVDLIWGRKKVSSLCDLCITTNNGPGEAFKELEVAFADRNYEKDSKTFDPVTGAVTSWTVAVPVVDRRCADGYNPNTCLGVACDPPGVPPNPCTNACPPSAQGKNERYHVQRVATMVITGTLRTPDDKRGFSISTLFCVECPTGLPLGKGVALVR
ncbi:MAG: hypothetical protein HYS23_15880 [Geobacter sp.]|nr:hypothetical protein [Geobacter sp.]